MGLLPMTSLHNVSVMSAFVVGVGLPVRDGLILMDVLEALPLSTSQHHLVSEAKLMATGEASLGVQSVEFLQIYESPIPLAGFHGIIIFPFPAHSLTVEGLEAFIARLIYYYYHGQTALATGDLICDLPSHGQWIISYERMVYDKSVGIDTSVVSQKFL